MNNNANLSPQEKREREYKEYERFIALAIIPIAIYLFWPFLFGKTDVEPAQVAEQRIENVEERKEVAVVETNAVEERKVESRKKITPPVVPPQKKSNQIRNAPIKRQPVKPRNENTFALTHNKGDKIEYITSPQNTGWRGIVQGKQRGSYTVKITEVLLANDKQRYLSTNNPCNGGKPIGKNAVNQVIVVPGHCIHKK